MTKHRCNICGKSTTQDLVGKDKNYSIDPKTHEVRFCLPCFDKWARNDEEYLLKKIKEKLLKGFVSGDHVDDK